MNNNNNNSRTNQWSQYYDQHQLQETTTPCFNSTSPSETSLRDGGCSAAGRRSRASRRAIPTTFLNANPSNFRALVQKFTGRSSGDETNRRKGPVTLDFRSPNKVSIETIFPVASEDRSNYEHDQAVIPHVSNEECHVTTTYGIDEESNNSVYGQDQDLLDHMDGYNYYQDFHQDTATLEEFMMKDLDL
ncbi:unnamed protein product [Cochlearia groenlandica]